VHGAVGEDGSLQGLLEVLGLPYVGSAPLASALAMHKDMARVHFQRAGLPVARGVALERREGGEAGQGGALAAVARARAEVGSAVGVKPSSHGSAIGVARFDAAATDEDVARALEQVWAIDDVALVEHFARGREVTCGVIELDGQAPGRGHSTEALPPTEILSPGDPFYTYEARYAPGRSVHVCPAALDEEVGARVRRIAVEAHRALGCRDLSRVDFVVGDGDDAAAITLLEVNTLPGMTPTSLYPEAAAARGLTMPALCDALVRRAWARGPSRRFDPRPLPGAPGKGAGLDPRSL
jgi:D-alanine-D-alanine ligase